MREESRSNPDGWLLALVAIASRTEANTQTIIRMMDTRAPQQSADTVTTGTRFFQLGSATGSFLLVAGRIVGWSMPYILIGAAMAWAWIKPLWRWLLEG